MSAAGQDKTLMRSEEVAEMLGVSKRTVWKWTSEGRLSPIKLSTRCTRWSLAEVESFIESESLGADYYDEEPEEEKPIDYEPAEKDPSETSYQREAERFKELTDSFASELCKEVVRAKYQSTKEDLLKVLMSLRRISKAIVVSELPAMAGFAQGSATKEGISD